MKFFFLGQFWNLHTPKLVWNLQRAHQKAWVVQLFFCVFLHISSKSFETHNFNRTVDLIILTWASTIWTLSMLPELKMFQPACLIPFFAYSIYLKTTIHIYTTIQLTNIYIYIYIYIYKIWCINNGVNEPTSPQPDEKTDNAHVGNVTPLKKTPSPSKMKRTTRDETRSTKFDAKTSNLATTFHRIKLLCKHTLMTLRCWCETTDHYVLLMGGSYLNYKRTTLKHNTTRGEDWKPFGWWSIFWTVGCLV